MSKRINHVAKACLYIEWATEWQRGVGSTAATETTHALIAQTHATLALVEQQRIANLIALANAHHASKSYDDFEVARHAAVYALIDYRWHGPDDVRPIVHPNISAALGIEAS